MTRYWEVSENWPIYHHRVATPCYDQLNGVRFMNDMLIELINEIQDCKCELEELNECGDLEDRMECALKLADLEQEHFKLKMRETGGL